MELIKRASELAGIPAPSGFESAAADYIAALCGGEVSRTPLGSVIAHFPGAGRRLLIACPIDRPGLITTEKDGDFWKLSVLGGFKPAAGLRLRSQSGRRGIAALGGDGKPECDNLRLDPLDETGAGEVFTLEGGIESAGGRLIGPGAGAALASAALLELMSRLPEGHCDLYLAFCVRGGISAQDAGPLAYAVKPDTALWFAPEPCDDAPGGKGSIKAGGGAVAIVAEGRVSGDAALVGRLARLCGGCASVEAYGSAVTRLMSTGSGCPAARLALPVRYAGTNCESAAREDGEKCVEALAALIRELSEK